METKVIISHFTLREFFFKKNYNISNYRTQFYLYLTSSMISLKGRRIPIENVRQISSNF